MSEIRIEPTAEQLTRGQTTRIPIVLVLDEATKVRGVHAIFHGAEETKATYTTYNAATKSTQTHTAVQHTDIIKSEFLLSGKQRKGFFGNLADGFATLVGSGEHEILEPGEYPFEVEVQIPADGPPTFEGNKCRVFYELSVLVDIPLGRDLKALASFRVLSASDAELPSPGHVRTRYPEDQQRGLADSWFAPDLRVDAALAEGTLREGDTIEGMFQVETPKPLTYSAINVRLIATEATTASGHTDGFTHTGEPTQIASNGVMDGSYSQEFSLPVACPGATTARGKLFTVDCFVQIELDVPWAKDPKIRIPVTLLPS